jgi:hypothetical protein
MLRDERYSCFEYLTVFLQKKLREQFRLLQTEERLHVSRRGACPCDDEAAVGVTREEMTANGGYVYWHRVAVA